MILFVKNFLRFSKLLSTTSFYISKFKCHKEISLIHKFKKISFQRENLFKCFNNLRFHHFLVRIHRFISSFFRVEPPYLFHVFFSWCLRKYVFVVNFLPSYKCTCILFKRMMIKNYCTITFKYFQSFIFKLVYLNLCL